MMDERRIANQAYLYTLILPIFIVIGYIVAQFAQNSVMGIVIFVLTIFVHFRLVKLKKINYKKFVAPVSVYLFNLLDLILISLLYSGFYQFSETIEIFMVLLQIAAIVFFVWTALKIKREYLQ
ncbi:MAG: hypothetical protein LBI43_00545 [Streptococcaceae bacterium]|jgi:hypothetical protein|nr:hypothetical protein [Streptococcaceae bacterium]